MEHSTVNLEAIATKTKERTCELQGAQHMISIKNLRFSSHTGAKVRSKGLQGTTREQP